MNNLVSATHIIGGGKPVAIDAEFTSTDTNLPPVKHSKKFERQQKINKKLEDKVNEEKLLKLMKAKKIELEIEKTQLERDSSKPSKEEEELSIKLKEEKEKSAKEEEQKQIDKIKSKFEIALLKFKDKCLAKDGASYEVPMYSCVVNESGKPFLKVLLDERGKRASWLNLSKGDRKREDWMSLIKPELKTITQLAKDDENAKILLSLLKQYSSIKITPAPIPAPAKKASTTPEPTPERKEVANTGEKSS